jgi:hypothetical protein
MIRAIVLVLCLSVLGACATSIEKAGIGELTVDCAAFTKAVPIAGSTPHVCIQYISGREIGKAEGKVHVIDKDGKAIEVIWFKIEGVKAFEGQAAAAAAVQEITKSVSGAIERTLPSVVEGAIRGARGLPPLPSTPLAPVN